MYNVLMIILFFLKYYKFLKWSHSTRPIASDFKGEQPKSWGGEIPQHFTGLSTGFNLTNDI